MALVQIATRVRQETVDRLDALIEPLAGRVPGAEFTRSDALRAAVERGIEVLEAEVLGARKKGARSARKPK